ncbi:hypothetical protein ACHQM5_025278 [Ranunculus cassubicifolius]
MGTLPAETTYFPLDHHHSILQDILEDKLPSDSLIYSYRRSFNGFAAKLNDRERQKIENMEGVVSVFPSTKYKPYTTRSWDFMGLKENVKRVPTVESEVIIGVIDTGIWPEAESFNDQGFGPPPKKWKGECKGGQNFKCNNKLIGARFYPSSVESDDNSSRDVAGHGTLVASIAAGNQVDNANFYSLANGNARGGVPSARLAVYKVCGPDGCPSENILAAFDDAIRDGVDILSVSVGSAIIEDYKSNTNSIGAYHAMKNGILTSSAAGNSGIDDPLPIINNSPWELTVAASTTDRNIIDKVILGDNTTVVGKGLNYFNMKGKQFPLLDRSPSPDKVCNTTSLTSDPSVEGKIVFNGRDVEDWSLQKQKAAGMILVDCSNTSTYSSRSYVLPTSTLNITEWKRVKAYIHQTKHPWATITKAESVEDHDAPVVATFSSRGPNNITQEILKPDLTAPGVDILAAWPPDVWLSTSNQRFVKYNMESGTSMSCPHATGAAAYVKSFHPDWSPSAIKSALMTTAFPMNPMRNPDAEYAYGAGHINPVKAVDAGLVYEAFEADYLQMLCSIGYTDKDIRLMSGDNSSSCPKNYTGSPMDLNYPSMASWKVAEAKFTRTVTNVGLENSTYKSTISAPPNMKITVVPDILSFKSLNEKQSFVVTVSATALKDHPLNSASLVWFDGVHTVRSPISVYL